MCQLCKKLDKRQISFNGRLGSTTKLSSSANLKVLLFPQILPQISALWGSLGYFLGRHGGQGAGLGNKLRDNREEIFSHLCGVMNPNPDV